MTEELRKEGYSRIIFYRKGKIRRFFFHLKNGRKDRFPICCILRFSFENALRDGKTYPLEDFGRKPVKRDDIGTFIPCEVFHHSER